MNIIFLLLPLALLLSLSALYGFWLAVKNDQYEDLETPAYRALLEEKKDGRN